MISTNVFVDLQLLWLASLALLHAASGQEQLLTQTQTRTVRLVLMPKSVDNPFFDPAGEGCMDKAASITRVSSDSVQVTCNYTGPPDEVDDASGALQAQMVRQLLADNAMDALAISVRSVDVVGPAIQEVLAAGIPVVTFDSDAPDSGRLCFIGTDNYVSGFRRSCNRRRTATVATYLLGSKLAAGYSVYSSTCLFSFLSLIFLLAECFSSYVFSSSEAKSGNC